MSNHTEDTSAANSKKLDRIMFLLEGGGVDTPGLVQTVAKQSEALFGLQGRNGLIQKVDVMWRVHIWVLCTLSGAAGYVAKLFLEQFKP